MATNIELYALRESQPLLEKVATSIAKAINTVATESLATANHAARLTWARQAMRNPMDEARQVVWLLLAQNAAASVATINAASDATLDSAVASLVNSLANVTT